MLRRLLMDSDAFTGEVIFTFDGDAAGMKAAERAFADDQKFMSQTFVAIEPTGMDPCELRLKSAATRRCATWSTRRIPLVEFVLRATVGRFDLDTAEGRAAALDRGDPAGGRDQGPRRCATSTPAGWPGWSAWSTIPTGWWPVRGLVRRASPVGEHRTNRPARAGLVGRVGDQCVGLSAAAAAPAR